jgi:NAD(P)-dependent dehydrogenase (short-subunit alcohol dehydrogenase family)
MALDEGPTFGRCEPSADRGKESSAALKNRVAFVTGSSRGIGAANAKVFAREGANVVVHGRDIGALASVRHDIEAAGGPH